MSRYPQADVVLPATGPDSSQVFNCPEGECPPWTGKSLWTVTFVNESDPTMASGVGYNPTIPRFYALINPINGSVYYTNSSASTSESAPLTILGLPAWEGTTLLAGSIGAVGLAAALVIAGVRRRRPPHGPEDSR